MNERSRRILAAAVVGALSLGLLAGCGGDDGKKTPNGSTTTVTGGAPIRDGGSG